MATMKILLSPADLTELLNEHFALRGINIETPTFKVEMQYEDRPGCSSTPTFMGAEFSVLNSSAILEGRN